MVGSKEYYLQDLLFTGVNSPPQKIDKGQLISKEILVSSILPKNERENFSFCPSLLGQKFFVRFFGRIENTKKSFSN